MKKVSKIILVCLLITITLLTIILINSKKEIKIQKNTQESNKIISMMLQDENGNYFESNDTSWSKEEYRFNKNKSKCINGSKIKFEDNNVVIKTTKADKCYVYFDNNSFVEDLSGNGNHGKAYNIVSWNENGITTSDENKKGYINCGLENYDFGESISLVIKYKLTKLSTSSSIFSSTQGAGIAIFYNTKLAIHIYTQTTEKTDNMLFSTLVEDVNTWHTIVATYDGKMLKMYDNGVNIGEKAVNGKLIMGNYPFLIGADPSNNLLAPENYSLSVISGALIFNRTLSEEEIMHDYANEINPPNKEDLLLWYKFN